VIALVSLCVSLPGPIQVAATRLLVNFEAVRPQELVSITAMVVKGADETSCRSLSWPIASSAGETANSASDRNTRVSSNLVPLIGNFSIQYNFTSASIAVMFLSNRGYLGYPLVQAPSWSNELTTPAVFIGAMFGMLIMGRLGDVVGRAKALQLTLAIAVVGSIIPACTVLNDADVAYGIIVAGRIVLGVGVGGIYPLSAVSAAEGSAGSEGRGSRVGRAFFGQSVGVVVPYILAMILLAAMQPSTPAEWVPKVQFRVLFAMGAVPATVVLMLSLRDEHTSGPAVTHQHSSVILALSRLPRETIWTLVGTSLSWFLYDIAFYGMTIFTPKILQMMCIMGTKTNGQCHQTLFETSWEATSVALMGIPGCILSIVLVDRWGSKRLMVVGFAISATLFTAMAIVWTLDQKQSGLLFFLFSAITFSINFGPNLGTYVMPTICFPVEVRSTCHGISATSGKLGALVGTLMFVPLSSHAGVQGVLWIQALISVIAAITSALLLKNDWEYLQHDNTTAVEFSANRGLVEVSPLQH